MRDMPETRYAKAVDGVHIAYQVFGAGSVDLVVVPGFISHLEVLWEHPAFARMNRRIGAIARVITFDKRGTGLSDRTDQLPDIDQRMLDLQAVINEVGSERPSIMGISEGGAMAIVYAATFPERVRSLVLYGSYAMPVMTDDHAIGAPREAFHAMGPYLEPRWGTGAGLSAWAPSVRNDPSSREWWARLQRMSASPGAAMQLMTSYNLVDVRSALPLVSAPTLVVHRTGDRMVPVELGRELADGIPDSRLVEFPGEDHLLPTTNVDAILDVVAEFLTGTTSQLEPERRLATVMFTDIVSSTEHVARAGDDAWRSVLDGHDELVETLVRRHGGKVVKRTGDGALALFDGPTRAIRCAQQITAEGHRVGAGIRAGLHTGEIVDREDDVAGIAVHLASRVSGRAAAGEVLVSRTLVDLVTGSGLSFEDRGEHELKGIEGTWRLFAVTADGSK
jgi:class 3 adenylate cyclase